MLELYLLLPSVSVDSKDDEDEEVGAGQDEIKRTFRL